MFSEWWSEFESATAGLHEWELVGDRAARRRFVDALAILYGYFVDWKSEPRPGQSTPAFFSAGMRSVISDAQTQAKQPETEPLASKRSPFKDPFRALRALAELRDVLTTLAGMFGDIVAGAVAGSVATQACLPRL